MTPRKDIEKLLCVFGEAGVRFVYFSPRNMRRTKEVASQMGIDVAWNCAISLRALDEGQDDPHRMTSHYADWDINAKLPHGINNVRKHLEEVDNVPLLVSLFTDVTKENTMEMVRGNHCSMHVSIALITAFVKVQTFQEYGDTVIACGLSHLSRNSQIFRTADIAIGVDALGDENRVGDNASDSLTRHELDFVTAIAATPCALRLKGVNAPSRMPAIIAVGRGAFDAAKSAGLFVLLGCSSLSLFCLFTLATVSTTIPYVPLVGVVTYLHVTLPILGFAMAMSDPEPESMKEVPPKNDPSQTFGKNERSRLYMTILAGALLPAVLPQFLWLIVFGELMIAHEKEFVMRSCGNRETWVQLVRCDGLKRYSGRVLLVAGTLVFAEMALCVFATSASLIHCTASVRQEAPWRRNKIWAGALVFCLALVGCYVGVVAGNSLAALPWYFYVLATAMPFTCLAACEWIKIRNRAHVRRAIMMRRLQFETR